MLDVNGAAMPCSSSYLVQAKGEPACWAYDESTGNIVRDQDPIKRSPHPK